MTLIAGPTASGKSGLAIELAHSLAREGRRAAIVNADSAQVYRDLRVLSARPSVDEMKAVPHVLFGTWDGATPCSAADWAMAAKREIARLHAEDTIPILVGGTGLYLRTLLEGIAPIPAIDPAIRADVRAMTTHSAFAALEAEDSEGAARLASADTTRILRALEVVRATGHPLAYWQKRKEGGIAHEIALQPVILLPDREWLYERCDRRFTQMMDSGAVEEVKLLRARALDPALPVMRAIGVPEVSAMLDGSLDRSQAIAAAQQATRRYAKRQYTWFKNQPPADWPRIETFNYSKPPFLERLLSYQWLTR